MKTRYLFKSSLLLILISLLTSFSPSDSEYLKKETNTPVFSAKGLHYEKLLMNIFRGDFVNIPFDRDETTFVLLLNQYIDAYAIHCANSLPANKVELMRAECVRESVTRNGYGMEISRTCIEWVDVGRGLYATPEMRNAGKVIERLQTGDAFRNMYKMISQENPIGETLNLVEKVNTIKTDMVSLLRMNGCKSAGLMRFQENLRLFALNKQPIRLDGITANKTIASKSQNFGKLAEDLVYLHSKKWVMNKYQRGSISNASITSRDNQNRPTEMRAKYIFQGFGGRSTGSVRITFSDGLPECLYFYDFPTTCRTADRRIVAEFANGGYQN